MCRATLSHVVGQLTYWILGRRDKKTAFANAAATLFWSADGRAILTTKLFPFSRRYREGVYAPIVIDIRAGHMSASNFRRETL